LKRGERRIDKFKGIILPPLGKTIVSQNKETRYILLQR
jgi:hypothetical protein